MKKFAFSILSLLALSVACGCAGPSAEKRADSLAADSDSIAEVAEAIHPDTATLIFFGDAMQHRPQFNRAQMLGTPEEPYNFKGYYTLIEPAIRDADYAVVNLELPLAGGTDDYTGFPRFNAPDAFAVELQKAGFDLLLTSNNHSLDRNDRGVRRTLDVLDSLRIDHIGTYRDAEERARLVPFIKEINGMKVGFLNYTYGTNGLKATQGAEVAYINRDKIKEEIEATRKAGAEIIVAMPHWGVEYVLSENEYQRSLADFMMKEGVDIIIGGHPHVVQPMKVIADKESGRRSLVVYSLGNFISNFTKPNTRGGAFVRVVIARNPSTGKVEFKNADYDTFITEVPSSATTNWRVVPRWSIDSLPASQMSNWTQHHKTSSEVFDRHNVDVPRSTRSY